MSVLPKEVSDAWDVKKGPVIFTTVNESGEPNSIYVTCVSKYDDETILIADNYFDKTRKNIFSGSKGVVLFITDEDKAFQIKGTIEYYKDGDVFENMKKWNPEKLPGHAVAAVKVEDIYSGAEKIV